MGTQILTVEDDERIRTAVRLALEDEGWDVVEARSGEEALDLFKRSDADVVLIDIMLPGIDGFEVCRRMRDAGQLAPVLFLTAKAEAEDRIQGFVTGGDDYVTKPFSVAELVLRVGAILRRAGTATTTGQLVFDDLSLDPDTHEVRRAGRLIELSPTEFRLLHYLLVNAGIVVSKAQILVNVWDDDFDGSENVVELYVGYLRRKIDDGRNPLIHTKRGAGYVLRAETT